MPAGQCTAIVSQKKTGIGIGIIGSRTPGQAILSLCFPLANAIMARVVQ
jgi:hypothetical protein